MNVVTFVDDLKVGIESAKPRGIGGHAHPGRGDAISRHGRAIRIPAHVEAVRHAADTSIVCRIAKCAGHALTAQSLKSRPARETPDLLSPVPNFSDRKGPRL